LTLWPILNSATHIREKKSTKREAKNPETVTQKCIGQKTAKLLTDLAYSKRTATSKAVNQQKRKND